MPLTVLRSDNRKDWLAKRNRQGIGGSEAAVIAGVSSFMNIRDLWEMKVFNKAPKDLSSNEEVARGVRMEPALRGLFASVHPELTISYGQYDILFQEELPFIFATLDGEITDPEGKKGILEIKTSSPNGRTGWDNWKEKVPDHYYVQLCHQLLATGYDFAILYAALIQRDGDINIREYRFERDDCLADMDWLRDKEKEFWHSVETMTIPTMTILF